ncbi:MAG: hypothetical protein ACI4IW_08100 [Oscillospiraceae bacterium]
MLKKVFAVIAVLMLTSCSAGTVSTEEVSATYQKDFSCGLVISCGEEKTEMECTKNALSITLSTVSPEEMSGLDMEISGGRLKLRFEGMDTEFDFEKLPEDGPVRLFCRLLDTLALPDEFEVSRNGKKITLIGKGFSAELDGENFGLLSARFPEENTEFTFSDWEFSGEK